jgi:hypothetical protein
MTGTMTKHLPSANEVERYSFCQFNHFDFFSGKNLLDKQG